VQLGALGVGAWTITVDGTEVAGTTLIAEGYDPGESMLKPPSFTEDVELAEGALVEATVTLVRAEPKPSPTGEVNQLSHLIASGMGVKSLVARPTPASAEQTLAAAVEAARAAQVAVVVVGLTEEQETEALDKHTLALPGEQDALVVAVAEAARRTVVVVNAATPVLTPWADAVDAVVVVGLPGQEGGHAVADALLGVREPAGRLVTSYPAADRDAPAWDVEPTDLALEYTDGTFIGYRGFAASHAKPPAWWFGHGLGYATWDYDAAQVTGTGASGAPRVQVTVRNTGERGSREVVQVYLQPTEVDEPVRLVGWAAAEVAAGDSATVTVECDARLWRQWDEQAGTWSSLGDGGELLVARGLGDIRHRLAL
jgi:beta-glucosidase